MSTKARTNLAVHLWTFPEVQPDLREKLGKEQDPMEKMEKNSKPEANPAEASDWAEQLEAAEPSNILPGPVLFKSADLRFQDSTADVRSKLSHKIKNFGVTEEKKSYRDRASTDNLMQYLEKSGERRWIIRMAVKISALTQKDY